jgi:hypoxanthine-guanine phosphoribosyltransferase
MEFLQYSNYETKKSKHEIDAIKALDRKNKRKSVMIL